VRLLMISQAAVGAPGPPAAGDGSVLSEAARGRASEVGRTLPRPRAAFSSPAAAAVETAAALGLSAAVIEQLRDWEPSAESAAGLLVRAEAWLEAQQATQGTRAAVTHGAVICAVVAVAIEAPAAFGRIDVAPCSVTELSFREGHWHLAHVNWEPALLHIPQRRGRRRSKGPA
jgi:broad specificity phosphatase PhoE